MEQLPDTSVSKDMSTVQAHSDLLSSFSSSVMTKEEQKIRDELETEIERDLEEEIKDGICRLALRLHRLYQNKARRSKQTEVNITIKMEGSCKIEIHESNKVRPQSSASDAKRERITGSSKQLISRKHKVDHCKQMKLLELGWKY